MSISTTASYPDKVYKKPFHRQNDSGEVDVFEAARYFAGYNESAGFNGADYHRRWRGGGGGRISLDLPIRDVISQHSSNYPVDQKPIKGKKYKLPTSPGGRLASFLNSLFSQSNSKKKSKSVKDEDESPGGRRKRRSSVSHFRSSSAIDSSKSLFSSSSSGCRTPPPYVQTPTKSYKDFRKSDHKQAPSLQLKPVGLSNEVLDEKIRKKELCFLEEKLKFCNGVSGKSQHFGNGCLEKERSGIDKRSSDQEKGFRKFNDDDDGAESDSSSDLFELQIYDLDCYSSGLPVYETTDVDSIKKGSGTAIANGAL